MTTTNRARVRDAIKETIVSLETDLELLRASLGRLDAAPVLDIDRALTASQQGDGSPLLAILNIQAEGPPCL